MKFNDLSIQEKAAVIKLGVGGGLRSLLEIQLFWDGMPEDPPEYYEQMEKVANENYSKWGYNNPDEALVHALNDNTYDYRGFYRDNPNARNNAETHWPDTYKTVYHPTFSNESKYSGVIDRNFNPEGRIGGYWQGEDFIPAEWQNEYKKGGSIHIKPENRGKFTALKKRTGHSATWFKAHGTPALKKMATFALNARKWNYKHPDGGPNDTIQTPNLVIDKYIGTKYDPTIWANKNFLINHNIQENQNALLVGDYFRSYANSEGAQRILNNQLKWYSSYHPIRDRWYGRIIYGNPENGGKNTINQLSILDSNGVFDLEDDVRASKHRSDHNHVATFIGVYAPKYGEYRYEDDYEYPEGIVLPHELMHRLDNNVLNGAQSEALNLNRNTIINGHDEFNDEKYGDLQGLKFLLYDNGIYDSRGNKNATADDIEKLRLLYPYLRPLQLMDNEKAAWMINHVVDNSNFRNDYINKIAYGGPIKPFSYLPIPEVRY